MRSNYRTRGILAAVLALALLVPLAIFATNAVADGQSAPQIDSTCPTGPVTVRGFQLCQAPIVFADATSGDLWVTDELGSGPYRITRTPAIEANPSTMGTWIAYDVMPRDGGNRDIFMMSSIGGARIQLTGLKSDDYDPSLGYPMDPYTGFGMPIVFSSDRAQGKQGGKCLDELFIELYGIFGPSRRVSECNRVDKFDAELAGDNLTIAFTGEALVNGDLRVWVVDDADQQKLPTGPSLAGYPSWGPGWSSSSPPPTSSSTPPAPAPDRAAPLPAQAAGNTNVTYASLSSGGGDLYSIQSDGSGKGQFLAAPNSNTVLIAPEWNIYGDRILFVRQIGTTSRVGWVWADTSLGDMAVTDNSFYVTGADWLSSPF